MYYKFRTFIFFSFFIILGILYIYMFEYNTKSIKKYEIEHENKLIEAEMTYEYNYLDIKIDENEKIIEYNNKIDIINDNEKLSNNIQINNNNNKIRWNNNGTLSTTFLNNFKNKLINYKNNNIMSKYTNGTKEIIFNEQQLPQSPNHQKIVNKMLNLLHYGGIFTFYVDGTSISAGHDVKWIESWPFILKSSLIDIFKEGDIDVDIENLSRGNTPPFPEMICLETMLGSSSLMGKDYKLDIIAVETRVRNYEQLETFIRMVALHPDNPILLYLDQHMGPNNENKIKVNQRVNGFWKTMIETKQDLSKYYKDYPGIHYHLMMKLWPYLEGKRDYNSVNMLSGKLDENFFHSAWHPGTKPHIIRGEQLAVYYINMMIAAINQYPTYIQNILNKNIENDNTIYNFHSSIIKNNYNNDILKSLIKLPIEEKKMLKKAISCKEKICNERYYCITSFEPRIYKKELSDYVIDWGHGKLEPEEYKIKKGNGTTWRKELIQQDQWPVRRAKMFDAGYVDLKYVLEGGLNSGELKIKLKLLNNKHIFICQQMNPGREYFYPNLDIREDQNINIKVDDKLVEYFAGTNKRRHWGNELYFKEFIEKIPCVGLPGRYFNKRNEGYDEYILSFSINSENINEYIAISHIIAVYHNDII